MMMQLAGIQTQGMTVQEQEKFDRNSAGFQKKIRHQQTRSGARAGFAPEKHQRESGSD